jgi:hypothetical protein
MVAAAEEEDTSLLSHSLSHPTVVVVEATFHLSLLRLALSRVHQVLISVRTRTFRTKWRTILRSIRSSIRLSHRFRPMRVA